MSLRYCPRRPIRVITRSAQVDELWAATTSALVWLHPAAHRNLLLGALASTVKMAKSVCVLSFNIKRASRKLVYLTYISSTGPTKLYKLQHWRRARLSKSAASGWNEEVIPVLRELVLSGSARSMPAIRLIALLEPHAYNHHRPQPYPKSSPATLIPGGSRYR